MRSEWVERFAVGARRVLTRACAFGGLVAVGWLLAVLFGALGASPAAADSTAATGAALSDSSDTSAADRLTGSPDDGLPTVSDDVSAPDNAEAMAGRHVDGLTSQSQPGFPTPAATELGSGANGFVPQSGGGQGIGPGDAARSVFDPQLTARRLPPANADRPVVRTAADEPSYSPD
ncbi:hypothetical protein [Sinosporangium album]|uniref:hypothetical protein n=1 Tax=Sinosporangium album TaxID=504805 RepID=UPI001FE046C8|nr:hypothetical protein [Sinosporangium album]